MLTFELPFPPSLNHYYRHLGHVTLISRRGRAYRETVVALLADQGIQPMDGLLELLVEFYPPDRRRRDADNFQKCLLDALAHAGVYHDDSQIVHLEVWKRDPVKGGKAVVRIQELTDVPGERPDQPPAALYVQPDRGDRRHRGLGPGLSPGVRRQVRRPRRSQGEHAR